MKRTRWTPDSPHNALRLALASATLLSLAAAPAMASGTAGGDATPSASGVYVTILSPNPGTALTGSSKIEISAYYESSYGVSSIDLFIDGRRMATQQLTSPEGKGEISFVVPANSLRGGAHSIVVRATATDAEVASARTLLNLPAFGSDQQSVTSAPAAPDSPDGSAGADSSSGPSIEVMNPVGESTVSGIVRIKVSATDPSGKSPYVSLFVDHAFKTLRNFPPYTFDWDTTRLPNGYHSIEVLGYNDAQQVGQAAPIRVLVNNPGGHTFERHDLSDTPDSAVAPAVRHEAAAKSPKVAAAGATRRKGIPMIAHAVKKSIAGLIGRADKLASIDSGAGPAGTASIDESLIAPELIGKGVASAVEPAKPVAHAPKLKLEIRAVVKPAYTISAGPLLASEPASTQLTEVSARSIRLDGIGSSDFGDLDSSAFSSTAVAPSIGHAATIAPNKFARIASANIGEPGTSVGGEVITTPHVDVARIKAAAVAELPAITSQRITIGRLTEADMTRVRGEYQVVVDDQRVELDRPLQDRGSVLFAPLRQIFESQGGQLTWDHAKRQVHAVSDSKDIVVTIGSKQALVNSQSVRLSGAPFLSNSRTMLPLDFFTVAMDARVSYDATTGHMIIESR